jgi:hypothetical protein
MPKISCIDINPDVEGCQAWNCNQTLGWFWNQNATYLPNPSNEVCCLVSFAASWCVTGEHCTMAVSRQTH